MSWRALAWSITTGAFAALPRVELESCSSKCTRISPEFHKLALWVIFGVKTQIRGKEKLICFNCTWVYVTLLDFVSKELNNRMLKTTWGR